MTREDRDMLVVVADASSLPQMETAVADLLRSHSLTEAVVAPLPIGRWDEKLGRFLIVNGRSATPPSIWTNDVTWAVAVRPVSVFDWRAVRAALVERGRPTLRESAQEIEVAARDEGDALALIEDLSTLPAVGSAKGTPLSWFRRWRVRQQLFGNYSDGSDPSEPA